MKDLVEEEKVKWQYLKYDFTYEGIRHKGKIQLDEDAPNVFMRYDDHDLEDIWFKVIRHKGFKIELNITIADDWNEMEELGKVVASAWVCVYKNGKLIDQFEPDCWAYTDEADETNNTCKGTFYNKELTHLGCKSCSNPDKCKRR